MTEGNGISLNNRKDLYFLHEYFKDIHFKDSPRNTNRCLPMFPHPSASFCGPALRSF